MSEVKQVKVDNWGIYFLQRLKHFFNRTDYCDLTLQFQDNAQLKVHRLVLSACTEYFELLERTCEMYEDCLVMPDDLQADVVVPIINFMYTGHLEFKMDLLEKLYQTSIVMNMPVLSKLLASHRNQTRQAPTNYYGKRYLNHSKTITSPSTSSTGKRSYSSAFENTDTVKPKKLQLATKRDSIVKNGNQDNHIKQQTSSPASGTKFPVLSDKNKGFIKDPRPTRYELPEELDEDNIYDNSFTNISYTSKPLMVHPETRKQYSSKRIKLFEEGSNSRFIRDSSNSDIVECKKISSSNNNLFIDDLDSGINDTDTYHSQTVQVKENSKASNQLFDQIIENEGPNITIETKNNKQTGTLDHAKIISEVLKKYPHLVKSNKNIKLKILNTANKSKKPRTSNMSDDKSGKSSEPLDFTYETDVIDSKEAARLIALGAENVRGPWICLICGTPGKALHFTSYHNFRKHLVEIHNEKPVSSICEYCGLKSQKRNYLVYHQLTKHNVEPPGHYNFPKCNYCKYIALNEALLVKHKLSHDIKSFRRNVANIGYTSSNIVEHSTPVKKTTNKYGFERKQSLQCIYCLRNFTRETNLYAHLKTNHKIAAKNDGLIDDSEEEIQEEEEDKMKMKHNMVDTSNYIKVEVPIHYESSYDDNNVQYQIERQPDGNINVVSKKQSAPVNKHKILNPGYIVQRQNPPTPSISKSQKPKTNINTSLKRNEYLQEICTSPPGSSNNEEIVVIDNNEYIIQDYQLIPKKEKSVEYLMTTNKEESVRTIMPSTSLEIHDIHNTTNPGTKMFVKKSTNVNQPIQIVVSNEEEYKAFVSNQSVIFEDVDANKGLTVLTQGGSAIETAAIDLDNTQNNDMMIIPENYAINVSEAVSANNPNIVVVYSHPVEDQKQQYQIITSQGIETQYVPTSALITQNYETVSTCTPVLNPNSNIDNSWQNIQSNINKLPIVSNAELHTMTVAESVTIAPETDANINVQEYAEVPIQTQETLPININQIVQSQTDIAEANYMVPNMVSNITEDINEVSVCQENSLIALEQPTVITNSLQQTLPVAQIEHIPTTNLNEPTTIHTEMQATPISTIGPMTTPTLNTLTESGEEIQSNNLGEAFVEQLLEQPDQQILTANQSVIKSVTENTIQTESSNEDLSSHVDTSIQNLPEDQIISQVECANVDNVPSTEDIDQTMVTIEQSEEVTENIVENDISVPNPTNNDDISQNNTIVETNIISKVAIAQIENLASEWSEDESDVVAELDKTDKPISDEDNTEGSAEVEETIANIQQEVEKHISSGHISSGIHPPQEITPPQNDIKQENNPQENPEEIDNVKISSQEKINSLLNDWDDNDSQEESPSTIENKLDDPNPKPQTIEENVEKTNVLNDKSELCKSDNIKSLVSDWDEDDEENKD